ncbi:hypothetical protein SAMN05421640_2484 [Ekhidna lutea]|uniref:Peptidase S74 domain-containing protein n=1 Tax=Ekhidna lutea TaxID=447679 RepID=A0A239K969_EKHLU|nr:hypothetical protein [Ekhidna lutea]SNT14173.1 hypothetical protein SAMN05421640_2484 [Ekhidna lutea]
MKKQVLLITILACFSLVAFSQGNGNGNGNGGGNGNGNGNKPFGWSTDGSFVYTDPDVFVGIRTSTPTFPFDVNGGINASSYYFNGLPIGVWQQNGDKISYNNGNVGIGTDNPTSLFHINQTNGQAIKLTRDGVDDYRIFLSQRGLRIRNNTDDRNEMSFDGDGNIGIGINNPSAQLHINQFGNRAMRISRDGLDTYQLFLGETGGLRFRNVTDSRLELAFDGDGNVGIGRSDAREKLDVEGNIRSEGVITNSMNVNGLSYPATDGIAGQVIGTDGAGNLTFQSLQAQAGAGNGLTPNGGNLDLGGELTSDVLFTGAGNFVFPNSSLQGLADPVNPQDASTKGYVDSQVAANSFNLSNGNGTTANGSGVDLGGRLSSNVAIDLDGAHSFSIIDNGSTDYQSILNLGGTGTEASLYLTDAGFQPALGLQVTGDASSNAALKILGSGGSNPKYIEASASNNYTSNDSGFRLRGFGESDDTGIGADYSGLVGTSLITKKYVDDLVDGNSGALSQGPANNLNVSDGVGGLTSTQVDVNNNNILVNPAGVSGSPSSFEGNIISGASSGISLPTDNMQNNIIMGNNHVLPEANLNNSLIHGNNITINRGGHIVAFGFIHEIGIPGVFGSGSSSLTWGSDNSNGAFGSYAGGIGARTISNGPRGGSFAHAFFPGSNDATKPANVPYVTAGTQAFNVSENTSAQIDGYGAMAVRSAILGGLNHHIPTGANNSAIIGGNTVIANTDPNTVYIPKLKIGQGNDALIAQGTSADSLLVMNSEGAVNYVPQSSILTSISASVGAAGNVNVSDGLGGFAASDMSYDIANRNYKGAGATFNQVNANSDNNFIYGTGINIIDNATGRFDHNFIVGNNHTINRAAGGSVRWGTMTGEEHSIINNDPNGDDTINNFLITGGYKNSIIKNPGGSFGIFGAAIVGSSFATIQGNDLTDSRIIAGNRAVNKASRSLVMGTNVRNEGFGSIVYGRDAGTELDGNYTTPVGPAYHSDADTVVSTGRHNVVFTANSTAQTDGHGIHADFSTVIGGVDHNMPEGADFSVILGGEAIKADAESHTVYLPKLKLGRGKNGGLDEGNPSDSLLVMSADGSVNYLPQSSLSPEMGIPSKIQSADNDELAGDIVLETNYANNPAGWIYSGYRNGERTGSTGPEQSDSEKVRLISGESFREIDLVGPLNEEYLYVFDWIYTYRTATFSIRDRSTEEVLGQISVGPGGTGTDTIRFVPSNSQIKIFFESDLSGLPDNNGEGLYRDWFVLLNEENQRTFSVSANNDGITFQKTNTEINNLMVIDEDGKVGIGTSNPDELLTVNGEVHAREVRVDLNVPGPDYVFEPSYKLPSLEDLEKYINKNKHLPYIPSAKKMEEEGISVGENQMGLLRTVEELVLHQIEMQKQMNELMKQNIELQKQLEELKQD